MLNKIIAYLLEAANLLTAKFEYGREYLKIVSQPRLKNGRYIAQVQFRWLEGPKRDKVVRHILAFKRPVQLEIKDRKVLITDGAYTRFFGERGEDASLLRTPRSSILADIIEASQILDYDSAQADAAYIQWKKSGARKYEKPKNWKGGELDSFRLDGHKFCCLLEAFEHAARGLKNWKEIDEQVIPLLQTFPGFEHARIPDEAALQIMLDKHMSEEERDVDVLPESLLEPSDYSEDEEVGQTKEEDDEDLPDWVRERLDYGQDDGVAVNEEQYDEEEKPGVQGSSQEEFSNYKLSNDEAFWLSQVAEDGSLPEPADEKMALRLFNHGFVDIYEHPEMHRDPNIDDQPWMLTDRGDVAFRSYKPQRSFY